MSIDQIELAELADALEQAMVYVHLHASGHALDVSFNPRAQVILELEKHLQAIRPAEDHESLQAGGFPCH